MIKHFALALLFGFLASCDTIGDHLDEVKNDVEHLWAGKDISAVKDVLGEPNQTYVSNHNHKVYVWITGREENIRILGGREIVRDGSIDPASQTHDHYNFTSYCKLEVATPTTNNLIVATRMAGQERTCSQFGEKLLKAKQQTTPQ